MKIGSIMKHEKYGLGTIIPSDDISIAPVMIDFMKQGIPPKYVCFDGIQEEELKEVQFVRGETI